MKKAKIIFLLLPFFALTLTTMISCDEEVVEPTATCSDGIQNGDETGVDCGGSCTACPTCSDGIQNGDETGIDCGGSCIACPTCSDGIQNGDETGVDCGGSTCPPCSVPFSEFITCQINGVDFAANLVLGNETGMELKFQSDQSQERQLFFTLPSGIAAGTYPLANNPGFEAEYRKLFDGTFTTESGNIIITENNTTDSQLSGTFEFAAVEYSFGSPVDTVIVTGGAFGAEY